MQPFTLALCLVTMAVCMTPASAERRHGTVSSVKGFSYLAKFCYDYTQPPPIGALSDGSTMTMSVALQAPRGLVPPGMRLFVYDDQSNSWPAVYGSDMSCALKISKSRNSTAVRWNMNGQWRMPLARIHEHVRPRFWYIVLANCLGFKDIEYEVQFINQGGDWKKQFGVNEQGLNTLYLVFFMLYAVGILVHHYALRDMWRNGTLHPIVKLLTAAIFLQGFSVFCGLVHYAAFVSNGFGVPIFAAATEIFNIAARLCFVLLLILIAKGWTISTDNLEGRSSILAALGVFASVYAVLLVWDVTGRDPASTLYVYESGPGLSIVLLDVLTALWFVSCIYGTHAEEKDEEKKSFYLMIGVGYTVWFLTVPTVVVISIFLDPWVREYTVTFMSLTVSTVAFASLALLLWPGRAEKYFRITTPDVMGDGKDDL